jgi:L-asparaginase
MGIGRRIRLFSLGGTISSSHHREGAIPSLSAGALLETIPAAGELGDIDTVDFAAISSRAMSVSLMHRLAQSILATFEEGFGAVVIAHGTDTLEETAYSLALMVPRGRSIVLTGAMRLASAPGSDGAANLEAALLVASSQLYDTAGPVVVVNDEVHTARWVTKAHSTRIGAFESPGAGPIGEVVEGRAHRWFDPAYEDYLGTPNSVEGLSVEIVRVAAGMKDSLVRAAIAAGPDGIILEGTGGGHVPPTLMPAVEMAVSSGIPVIVSTRCSGGRSLERTYQSDGSETDLISRGVLPAGAITGLKARLRLLIGCALGQEPRSLFPV